MPSAGPAPSVRYLDARDLEPTPVAFRQALERAGETADETGETSGRSVLMIDTFEALRQRWREHDLPRRIEGALGIAALQFESIEDREERRVGAGDLLGGKPLQIGRAHV